MYDIIPCFEGQLLMQYIIHTDNFLNKMYLYNIKLITNTHSISKYILKTMTSKEMFTLFNNNIYYLHHIISYYLIPSYYLLIFKQIYLFYLGNYVLNISINIIVITSHTHKNENRANKKCT